MNPWRTVSRKVLPERRGYAVRGVIIRPEDLSA